MKSKVKKTSGKRVRESVATYKATRKYAKCRELTGKELGLLLDKMLAAHDRDDRKEVKRLEKELTNGFYGEIRA